MPTSPAPFIADAARALTAVGCAFATVRLQEDMPPGSIGGEVPPKSLPSGVSKPTPQRGERVRL
jgi:hypothetical protein